MQAGPCDLNKDRAISAFTISTARQGAWQWMENSRLPDEPLSV